MNSDDIVPFHVPPPVNGGNQHRLTDTPFSKGKLRLAVVFGGPVYLVMGTRSTDDFVKMIGGAADNIDFDLAAPLGTIHELEVQELQTVTILSTVESIGYLRLTTEAVRHG